MNLILKSCTSIQGRSSRSEFLIHFIVASIILVVVQFLLSLMKISNWAGFVNTFYLLSFYAISQRRMHDINRRGWRVFFLLIPILGPIYVLWCLFLREGSRGENAFGPDPLSLGVDYLKVDTTAYSNSDKLIVNDVTGVNPIEVWTVSQPQSIQDVVDAVKKSNGSISVGGGHFSMGGQTASKNSLHLDMRKLNKILQFDLDKEQITVQAGARWCDLQRFLDPHGYSVKIMQTYANFTVGGSIGVNVHGRYVGLGPLILSVVSLKLVLADGSLKEVSRETEAEIFFGVVGGYGGLGIVVEACLQVVKNCRVKRLAVKMSTSEYLDHFSSVLHSESKPVFHNGDLYPPDYKKINAATWFETEDVVTEPYRLPPIRKSYPLERYMLWAISETPFGKWRRQFLFDPLLFFKKKVHWKNYEAAYDVMELEPRSRKNSTYVLHEYFIPLRNIASYMERMAELLQRHEVNMLNISLRHAVADDGSILAWAHEEVFAFVMYYKQGLSEAEKGHVAIWTRELIDLALEFEGTYYLPYQIHATHEQFHASYPRYQEFFNLKQKLDPEGRLRNSLWDKYYFGEPEPLPVHQDIVPRENEFELIYSNTRLRDQFFYFLQNVFRLHPEDRFHQLIWDASIDPKLGSDERVYQFLQERLPSIRSVSDPFRYALPALKKQKQVLSEQTCQLLGDRISINGYLEIGSPLRYYQGINSKIKINGPVYSHHEVLLGNSPMEMIERGQLFPVPQSKSYLLGNYDPIPDSIESGSLDLVCCYIGLHHIDGDRFDKFLESISRVLRKGGVFILRDHDVTDPVRWAFVSLVHTVFNLGTGASWLENQAEPRYFNSLQHWVECLEKHGLEDRGDRLLQDHDPSWNTLMRFDKV